MADELSDVLRRREAAPSAIGDVFSSFLEERAGAAGRVTRAWYAANGDIERAHTTGTFVREPRRGEAGPVLVVYVDSKARVTDFSANREIYLARLAHAGLSFSKIEFRLSKYPRREAPTGAGGMRSFSPAKARPRVTLTAEEEAMIERMCASLPATLREKVSEAMRASYCRQRAERAVE